MTFVGRYLWSVSPHFTSSTVLAGCLALFGVWAVKVLPEDVGAAYIPILFGQLFVASSGFRQAADAGHLDALFVSGADRILIGTVHFALSAGPGILAWLTVYGAELHTLGADGAIGLRYHYVVALLLVSSVAWAVTLPTVRFAGGVLWVVAAGLIAVSPEGLVWLGAVVSEAPDGVFDTAAAVAALVLCPFLLLVPFLDHVSGDVWVLRTLTVMSVAVVTAGVSWVVSRDYAGPS